MLGDGGRDGPAGVGKNSNGDHHADLLISPSTEWRPPPAVTVTQVFGQAGQPQTDPVAHGHRDAGQHALKEPRAGQQGGGQ